MTQNQIIILGIIELLTFFAVIYLIIRANIFVNALQQEVNELHLCLPVVLRDIRYDLSRLNSELSAQACDETLSHQQLGAIVGEIFTEIILFRINSLKFSRRFMLLSMVLKAFNVNKLLKPLFLLKNIR